MTVTALIAEYREYHDKMRRLSATTRKVYGQHLRNFDKAHEGLTIGGLTASVVRRYIAEETARSKHIGYGTRSALVSLCAYAQAEGWIATKPTDAVESIKPDCQPRRAATIKEIRSLFAACDKLIGSEARKSQARAFISLLTYGGLRISEALAMRVCDIDLVSGLLVVVKGKGGKRREIYPCEECFPFIVAHRIGKAQQDLLILLTLSGGEYLFSRIRKIAHCEHVTPHQLRHAIANRMLDNGETIKTVQDFLGHENVATTSVYLDMNEDNMKRAAKSGSLNPVVKETPAKPSQQTTQRTGRRMRVDLRK